MTQTIVLEGYQDDLGRNVEHEFEGVLLGAADSHREDHVDLVHPTDEFAPQGVRCSACRWYEIKIYREDYEDNRQVQYVVQTVGHSIVPGETTRSRVHYCPRPQHVVAVLVQHRGEDSFIPHVAKRALDRAGWGDQALANYLDEVLGEADPCPSEI